MQRIECNNIKQSTAFQMLSLAALLPTTSYDQASIDALLHL
jgi:hypothetical protein